MERLTCDESGIVVFCMYRPQTKNAISKSLLAGFYQAIESVKKDRHARVIIIKSNVPNAFCAGADLKERETMTQEQVLQFVGRIRKYRFFIFNLFSV